MNSIVRAVEAGSILGLMCAAGKMTSEEFTSELQNAVAALNEERRVQFAFGSASLADLFIKLQPEKVEKIELVPRSFNEVTLIGVQIDLENCSIMVESCYSMRDIDQAVNLVMNLMAPIYLARLERKVIFDGKQLCRQGCKIAMKTLHSKILNGNLKAFLGKHYISNLLTLTSSVLSLFENILRIAKTLALTISKEAQEEENLSDIFYRRVHNTRFLQ